MPIHLFAYSDAEKLRSTHHKLISLHREFNDQDKVIECYGTLTSTYPSPPTSASPEEVASCSQVWLDFVTYLLGRELVPEQCWEKVSGGLVLCERSMWFTCFLG